MTAISASAYLDAIAHLPAGATLILLDVEWDDYERLVDENSRSRSSVRITYDRGRLEVMSPTSEHDHLADMCTLIAHVLGEETGSDVESFGSTTLKQTRLVKGAERCLFLRSERAANYWQTQSRSSHGPAARCHGGNRYLA